MPPDGADGSGGRNGGGGRSPSSPVLPSASGAGDTDPRRPKPEVSAAGSAEARIRAENPTHPADHKTVEFMNILPIDDKRYDSGEITDSIHQFNRGEGSKLKITPNRGVAKLNVSERENGNFQLGKYDHHFVYYKQGYIYDPRLSSTAFTSGGYFELVKQFNPEGFHLEEEVYRFAVGTKAKDSRSVDTSGRPPSPILFGPRESGLDITNNINLLKLQKQLSVEERKFIFNSDGTLSITAIKNSQALPIGLKNAKLLTALASFRGSLEDWRKYETTPFRTVVGLARIHFYHNRVTGDVYYGMDYKVIYDHQGKWNVEPAPKFEHDAEKPN